MNRFSLCFAYGALAVAGCATLAATADASAQPPAQLSAAQSPLASVAADFAGVAYVVVEPDSRSHSGAIGIAAPGVPFSADTPVALYSVAKPMTATLAVLLASEGVVDFDRPIGSITTITAPWDQVTLRELLSHSSGMRHYREGEWLRLSRHHCARTEDALADFIADPPAAARHTFSYSTFGYVLVSHVLASAAHQDFPSLIARRIFEPSGMRATLWTQGAAPPPSGFEGSRGHFRPARPIDNSCKFGAGAVTGSATDLARFGAALASGRLMPVDTARQMLVSPIAGGTYGLGWGLGTLADGTPIASHTGSGLGGTSAIIINLRSGRVAAVVGNVDGPSLGAVARDVLTREFPD